MFVVLRNTSLLKILVAYVVLSAAFLPTRHTLIANIYICLRNRFQYCHKFLAVHSDTSNKNSVKFSSPSWSDIHLWAWSNLYRRRADLEELPPASLERRRRKLKKIGLAVSTVVWTMQEFVSFTPVNLHFIPGFFRCLGRRLCTLFIRWEHQYFILDRNGAWTLLLNLLFVLGLSSLLQLWVEYAFRSFWDLR